MEIAETSASPWLRRVPSALTYADFLSRLKVLLLEDSNRANTEAFLLESLKSAIYRMQRLVPNYRMGFRLPFPIDRLQKNLNALSGWFPRDGLFRGFMVRNQVEDWEVTLDWIPFGEYTTLVATTGLVDADGAPIRNEFQRGFFTIDPEGDRFHIAPILSDQEQLVAIYDNLQTAFEDDDGMPWGEEGIQIAADFVKAKFAKHIHHDIPRHNDLMVDFTKGLRSAYLLEKKKRKPQPLHLPDYNYDLTGYENYADKDGNFYAYVGNPQSSF